MAQKSFIPTLSLMIICGVLSSLVFQAHREIDFPAAKLLPIVMYLSPTIDMSFPIEEFFPMLLKRFL